MTQYKRIVCQNKDCYINNRTPCATNILNQDLTEKQLSYKNTLKVNPTPFTSGSRLRMCWYYMPIETEEVNDD